MSESYIPDQAQSLANTLWLTVDQRRWENTRVAGGSTEEEWQLYRIHITGQTGRPSELRQPWERLGGLLVWSLFYL